MPKKAFEDYTNLREGKICPKGHVGPDGKNVKNKSTGHCLACFCGLPNGSFTHQFENVEEKKPYKKKYMTEEESKAARSRASMRWTAKNKDKAKEYYSKYSAKPERVLHLRKKHHDDWLNRPEEERKAIIKLNYEREIIRLAKLEVEDPVLFQMFKDQKKEMQKWYVTHKQLRVDDNIEYKRLLEIERLKNKEIRDEHKRQKSKGLQGFTE